MLCRIEVLLGPRMFAPDNLVEPNLGAIGATDVAVRDDLIAAQRQLLDLLVGAAIDCGPIAHSARHGYIFTPAPFVGRVAIPGRGFILGAVNF